MIQENILEDGKCIEWILDSGPKNTFTQQVLLDIIERSKNLKTKIEKETTPYRLLILTSRGEKYFSNGLDPDLFLDKDKPSIEKAIQLLMEASHSYFTLPIPTIAFIEGHCMGAGAVFAILSDYRYMVEGSGRIGFPESSIHLNFPSFPARVLADIVGRNQARDLLYTGKLLKPKEALDIGLVDGLETKDSKGSFHKIKEHIIKLSYNSANGIKVSLTNYYQFDYQTTAKEDIQNLVKTISSPEGQESFRRLKQII